MAADFKILAADSVSLSGSFNLPRKKFKIVSDTGLTNEQILSEYPDFDILLIRSTRKIDKDFIDKCSFKLIATFTKGTDHIDMQASNEKGIVVINAEEGNHISAAEHTLALILGISKNMILSDKLVRENKFLHTEFRRNELFGKTIGIIGFGKVGSCVGKFCNAFGMNVVFNDIDQSVVKKNKKFAFVTINYLLKKSDFVSLHIPYSVKNDKFFSQQFFQKMKKDSVFINTSRGAVVDEEALISSLKSESIRYAGLDVFMSEPLIDRRFADLKNVILTNHIAGKTVESKERISDIMFEKIRNYFL